MKQAYGIQRHASVINIGTGSQIRESNSGCEKLAAQRTSTRLGRYTSEDLITKGSIILLKSMVSTVLHLKHHYTTLSSSEQCSAASAAAT